VLFHFDKSSLTSGARSTIQNVASQIKGRAAGPVQVTGYTDSIGSDQVNGPLSQARARSVVAALGPLTPGKAYRAAGLGSADPVAPNTKPSGADDPPGRALNRRVAIVFAVKKLQPPTPPPASPVPQSAPAAAGSRTVGYDVGPSQYQVTVSSLVRESDLLVLKMTIGCVSSSGGSAANCDGETDLAGTHTVPPLTGGNAPGSDDFNSISGFYLFDPSTGSEYIPLRDTDNQPLVAGVNDFLHPGASYPVWAYYPAPPQSVSSLTVELPGGAPSVSAVAISS